MNNKVDTRKKRFCWNI